MGFLARSPSQRTSSWECYLLSGYFSCYFSFRRTERKENELQGGTMIADYNEGLTGWRKAGGGYYLLRDAGWKEICSWDVRLQCSGVRKLVIFMMGRRNYWFLFIRKMGCKIRRLKLEFKGLDLRTASSSFQGPLSSFEHILTWCRNAKALTRDHRARWNF